MRLEFNRTVTQDVDLRLCETKQKASGVVAFSHMFTLVREPVLCRAVHV